MNEKFSHRSFDRVVGLTDEMKGRSGEVNNYIDKLIDESGGGWIDEYEVEKSDLEKEIINFVVVEADRILQEYGREEVTEIAQSNIHILKEDGTREFTEGRLMNGSHSARLGSVLVDRADSKVQFALVLFHELMHMKSYKALQQVTGIEDDDLNIYRCGFSVTSRDGKTSYFKPLEEAVISFLTKKFSEEVIMNDPFFSEEVEEMKSRGEVLSSSRMSDLETLDLIVDRIWDEKHDDFNSREDIFELFIKAQVNGNILPVGRLVEEVFGKGSFRKLGEINYEE